MNRSSLRLSLIVASLAAGALWHTSASAADWFPYKAESIVPPFSADGKSMPMDYVPLGKASKKWNICVSFPHMKDAYWLGVDYGVVEEARREGVKLQVVDAGGYTNLAKQVSQIEDCVANGANAVIIGAISGDGLGNVLKTVAAKKVPIIDLVNGINSPDVSAKSLVSFYTMGHSAGEYLAKKHPAGSPAVKVGWFPGPAGAGWVEAANKGFYDAVKGSAVTVLDPNYGDTGKEVQSKLVEDIVQGNPDLAYVAGTAVTAEAATSILRARELDKKIKVISFYMTPGVYEGIQKGRIVASPADSMVIQGRIAVDQAVRLLEGKDVTKHVGPKIFMVDSSNIKTLKLDDILPPPVSSQSLKSSNADALIMDTTAPLLKTVALSKQYPGVRALDTMDFELRSGEVHVLFGENGAGKSTLISLLAGANTPTSGEIFIRGQSIQFSNVHDARKAGVGAVFQEFSLVPTLSVARNLSLGDEPLRHGLLDVAALNERAKTMLADLGFEIDCNAAISKLTRAQQQMVEIAKGLRAEVSVLILDEPTASLTEKETSKLFELIERLKARGVGIIYISHRMQEIEQIADRITVMRDGKKITTLDAAQATPERLIELMSGRSIEQIYPKITSRPGEVVLEVHELSSLNHVKNASITVRAGEVVGFAGLVGAGSRNSSARSTDLSPSPMVR